MPVPNHAAQRYFDYGYNDDDEEDYYIGLDKSPWSKPCEGAPWWYEDQPELEWEGYLDGLYSMSSATPDNAQLSVLNEQLVFVYGTLKKGFKAHDLLEDAKFLGRGWTKLKAFKLVRTDSFPAALMGASGPLYKAISGEMYVVRSADMKHLDNYEQNGSLFHRRRVAVDLEDGTSTIAWMYLANQEKFQAVTRLCPEFTRKKNGLEYYAWTREGK